MRWLLSITGLIALVATVVAARGDATAPDAWEYLVQFGQGSGVKPDRHKVQLDSLGSEGWELVTAVGAQMGGNTGTVVFYLKRRRP